MNDIKSKKINKNIEGSMLLSLLNRVKATDAISNSTYSKLKKQIILNYQLNMEESL